MTEACIKSCTDTISNDRQVDFLTVCDFGGKHPEEVCPGGLLGVNTGASSEYYFDRGVG
jgi:hypothetical protein